MYFVLCISLILAALLLFNLALSAAAGLVWRAGAAAFERMHAGARARLVFFLSVAPFAAAFVLTAGVILPAYLLFEPHESSERVGLELGLAAVVSFVGVAVASYRVFGSWWTTRRLVGRWMNGAERVELDGVDVPVYKIRNPFPVVAVVGALRPRMFVAGQVLESLSEGETEAAVRHELGHLASRDNLKRVLMRISRDVLVLPLGKHLERAWNEAAESAADEFAARAGGRTSALELASALVKIARIVPAGRTADAIPGGTFLISEESDFISRRVRRLVEIAGGEILPAQAGAAADFIPVAAFSFVMLLVVVFADVELLRLVHDITERFVAAIQ